MGAQFSTNDPAWLHASLPVSLGGLGIRSTYAHCSAAFVASTLQTATLVQKMLDGAASRDAVNAHRLLIDAMANVTKPLDLPIPVTVTQKQLSRGVDESRQFHLQSNLSDTRSKALLSSVKLPHTGDFLNVVPSGKLGLKLDSVEFQLACQYRLGLPVFHGNGNCSMCGRDSDQFGDHAISACGHYGDRSSRHDDLRDAIFEAAQAGSLAPVKEERHLLDDGSHPGDITIRNWHRSQGRHTAFDVTVTSPLQQNCIEKTEAEPTFA
jgi:hypothetical protein